MADSIATSAKTESAQPDFSHGLLDFCTFIHASLPSLLICVESLVFLGYDYALALPIRLKSSNNG
jgi:hypothetical protein